MTLGPPPKCLQRGAPACPELYEEWWYERVPSYALVPEVVGTAMTQYVHKICVGYNERLHIGLAQCLLGLGHEGGHLTDSRHGRIRWSIVEDEEEKP